MEKLGTFLLPAMKGLSEQEAVIAPDNFDQMQCDWYNAATGNLTGYDCPECKNRGYFAVLESGYQQRKECRCMKIRRNLKNISDSGLEDALQTLTFDRYICKEPWQKRAKDACTHYVNGHKGRWLYVSGQSGAGKTHLCTAVCGALLERGMSVKYEMWRTLFREMQRFDARDRKFQQISDCDVLYIDDFLKSAYTKPEDQSGTSKPDRGTFQEINVAFEIINSRYTRKKITILSSEIFLQDLFHLDGALAGRIRERCGGYVIQIAENQERNYRMGGEFENGD